MNPTKITRAGQVFIDHGNGAYSVEFPQLGDPAPDEEFNFPPYGPGVPRDYSYAEPAPMPAEETEVPHPMKLEAPLTTQAIDWTEEDFKEAEESKPYGPETPGYIDDGTMTKLEAPTTPEKGMKLLEANGCPICLMSHGHHFSWCPNTPQQHGGGQAFAQGTAKLK